MFFPEMKKGAEKKSLISVFGGLNRGVDTALGELCDMSNLTSDNFPYLSVSADKYKVEFDAKFNRVQGFIPFEELKFTGVADGKFYYNNSEIPFAYSFMTIPKDAKIQLINFADSIIIMPYLYVFEYKNAEKNNKLYPLTPGIYNSYINVDTGGANRSPITVTLDGYTKTWAELGIKSGDSVVIQTDEEQYSQLNVYISKDKYDIPTNYNTVAEAIVVSATDDTLKINMYDKDGDVMNITDTRHEIIDYTFKHTLRIFKKYPKFKNACIYANRLWVTSENGETIHASAPGKPGEFTDFSGLSTDSWYTEVGESGMFTGISSFRDGVVVFKENNIYHFYGDRATNFNIAKKFSNCGCVDEKSVCETDTAVYFLSNDGVYEYSDGNPENISRKLNLKNCVSGNAFSDGKKYYISLNGEKRMYVYDRTYGLWHIEGDFLMDSGAEFKNSIYFVSTNEVLKMSDTAGNEWYAILCDITEKTMEQKGINDIFIRAENSENSYIEVYVRTNDGDFKLCGNATEPGEYTFRIPVRFKKGDKYSIKISGKGNAVIKDLERSFYVGGGAFTRKG